MIYAAIVGTGNISASHIQGLMTFPERCKIAALVDIYPEKAEAAKVKYQLEDAQVFDSHEALLASGLKIDLVHVCTPPSSHAQIAIDSMKAGCNLLVEKPMAPSLKECDAMLEAEKKYGVTMGIVAQNRFRNSIYKLKKSGGQRFGRKSALRSCKFLVVERTLLLRFMVERHLGKRRGRPYPESCRASYRYD